MSFRIYYIFLLELVVFNQAAAQLPNKTYQQIQLLINEKSARTPAQKKIDSRLLQFERQQRGRTMAAGVTPDDIKLDIDSRGFIKVDIRAEVDDKLLGRIEALGGKIVFSSFLFHTITSEISPHVMEELAALPEISFIAPAPLMVLQGVSRNKLNALPDIARIPLLKSKSSYNSRAKRVQDLINHYLQSDAGGAPQFSGTVTSQGDKAHRADEVRNVYGYAGQGIRVGLLSDSYNARGGAAADVAGDDLPGVDNPAGNTQPVTVLEDYAGGDDEGRAMLQIVHDLAPKAQLFFATAYGGPANFAATIIALRNAPYYCDIIIDDIFYNNEPVFYDGVIAQAVNTVTAGGALYFVSAANNGSLLKGTSGVFEGDFNDTGSPAFPGLTNMGTIHNFGTVSLPVMGDSVSGQPLSYLLHWADPPQASTNDYDLFLISSTGEVKAFSTNIQSGTQDPVEQMQGIPPAPGDQLVVFKSAGAEVRAFHLNSQGGVLRFATCGQIFGHFSAEDAFTVAATPAEIPFDPGVQVGPFPGAFSSANKVENFSSDGPRRIFFNANGTPVTPGNFLFATGGGIDRNKPDITAADGVVTTLWDGSGLNPFYGTSASAPHAGAIAALLKSADPSLTSTEVRKLLTSTALDIEAPGYDNNTGYGILQAFQAMQLLNPRPVATISLGTITVSEGSFSNNNGRIDPGEIGNLTIQLTNPSMVDATAVYAVLTTSTEGISIIQGASGYGTASAGGNVMNVSPFRIAVLSNVVCGTYMEFTLTTFFTGGSAPLVSQFSLPVGLQPFLVIRDTIGVTPHAGAGYSVVSGEQSGRILRSPVGSTCLHPVASIGLTDFHRKRNYNAYTFSNVNSTSQCVTVTITSPNGTNLHCVAYNDSGFVPSNPAAHYLAQGNASALIQTFSFAVAGKQFFTVVVHDVSGISASHASYGLSLSLSDCAPGPACTQVNITTDTILAGATGDHYLQKFAANGGSSAYRFSVAGNLPGGISFNGDSLSGTPGQAGIFPIKMIATDLAGCTADTSSYDLIITGIVPASITVVQGTPQIVYLSNAFPESLQVVVRDAGNNALGNVNVIFNAPASGASGTFTGGVQTITILTNADGLAMAPAFTSNAVTGSYIVTAAVTGLPDANFNLTNFCPANFVVTTSADSGPGSLRERLNNGCAGVPIIFDPSITRITLTSGELMITKATTINGPGAFKLAISGNNNSRIFNIATGAVTVSISGITIREGRPPGAEVGGGAILVNDSVAEGIVNFRGCVITANDVSLAAEPFGGGLYNKLGTVHIDRSAFTNNVAIAAGGILNEGGAMLITNSTIAGNVTSAISLGGGIYNLASLILVNCTVYGNTAKIGANIYITGDSIRLKNTVIGGGMLPETGGASPDLSGNGFRSDDYNFIEDPSGVTLTGIATHNITGISALLFPLANYGGEIPSLLPQPMSPVINAGNPAIFDTSDQRGFPRIIGRRADMGAVEANYSLSSAAGNIQAATVLTPFAVALTASVTESAKNVSGATVVFTAPATGAGGTFTNGLTKDTVVTNLLGVASSHTFTANNVPGTYLDTATIGNAFPLVTYSLANIKAHPLQFLSLTASASNCTVNIYWNTPSETDNKYFTIEYSQDGVTFNALATVDSRGNSSSLQSYSYTHVSTLQGAGYYRIRQTDTNGQFTLSNVLIVTNQCGSQPIVVYPNPVVNNLTVIIPGTDTYTLRVFDAAGQIIHRQSVQGGSFEIRTSGWIKGTYILSITQKDRKVYSIKLIKE